MTFAVAGTVMGLDVHVSGWLSASLDITIGAANDAWVPSADVYGATTVLDLLDAWLNAAARPWFGAATFTTLADFSSAPYFIAELECSAACTYAPNAALQTLFGWPAAGQTATRIYSDPGMPSVAVVLSDVAGYAYRQQKRGAYSGGGAYCADQQLTALRYPATIELLTDELGTALVEDALQLMADPATIGVVRLPYSDAVTVTIRPGEITRDRSDGMVNRYTIEGIAE